MRKSWTEALFWGACWGLLEATLGYVIHFTTVALPGLPGFLMFPVAFWVMRKASQASEDKTVILRMSAVAATLKLLDLLIPGNDPIRIINPAISILMEGAAVYAVMTLSSKVSLTETLSMGVIWRGAFLIYMLGFAQLGLPAGLVTNGLSVALRFLLLESAVNALLMSAIDQVDIKIKTFHPQVRLAFPAIVLAIFVTVLV